MKTILKSKRKRAVTCQLINPTWMTIENHKPYIERFYINFNLFKSF